jgi:hypothetical protein
MVLACFHLFIIGEYHIVIEDNTIKDESRVTSLEAPKTSPEIPPKLLFETYCIAAAIARDTLNDVRLA